MLLRLSGVNYARCKPLHRRGRGGDYRAAWPRHRPERGFCRRSLAVKHGSRYRSDRHAESADGTERRLRRRVGIHTRAFLALSLAPGGDALGLSAAAAGWLLALVAWYGGQDWPAMLPDVACGGAGAAVAWRIAAGRSMQCGPRLGGATLLSVVVVIAATLLAQHTAGAGRSGVCFAFAVLLDLSLLGALIVRIRQLESAA